MYLKSFIHLICLSGCTLISKEDKSVLLVKHGWMFCEAICYMSFRVSRVLVLFFSSVLLVLRLPCLGKRELILVLFVRLYGLCLFRFVGFLFLLGSGKGCGL